MDPMDHIPFGFQDLQFEDLTGDYFSKFKTCKPLILDLSLLLLLDKPY
jgi:hypothetical protein